jgi:hypothetical protein
MLAGDYERAVQVSLRAIQENPNFHAPYRPLIASLGHMGKIEDARQRLVELRKLEPDFSVGWFRANYPPLPPDHADRYVDGLRKAGVNE